MSYVLHLCVLLYTDGSLPGEGSLSREVSVQGVSVQGRSLSRGVSVQGVLVWGYLSMGVSIRETLLYGKEWAVCIPLECILVSNQRSISSHIYKSLATQAIYSLNFNVNALFYNKSVLLDL